MPRLQVGALCGVVLSAMFVLTGCDSVGRQSSPPEGEPHAGTPAQADPVSKPIQAKREPSFAAGHADQPPAAKQVADQVVLRIADRQVYEQVLARHRGKPILVDFWATWCVPCTEQFPHTVELHAKYAAKGLALVAVSLDDPANEAKVEAFLKKQRATFDNLLSKWGSDDPSFENFDIPAGTIPHYKLYDRDGQLRETFSVDPAAAKQFTPADIERSVISLLSLTSSCDGVRSPVTIGRWSPVQAHSRPEDNGNRLAETAGAVPGLQIRRESPARPSGRFDSDASLWYGPASRVLGLWPVRKPIVHAAVVGALHHGGGNVRLP